MVLVQSSGPHDVRIEDPHPPGRYGSERQFLLPRDSKLPHHIYIERDVKRLGDLEGHHHPSSGQTQDDEVTAALVPGEPSGKRLPCVGPVGEYPHGSFPPHVAHEAVSHTA